MERLTETQRYVFNLLLDPEMNQNKISKTMGLTRQAVYNHCKLLKKKHYLNEDNTTTVDGRAQFLADHGKPERLKISYANKNFVC